jgi:signal transduction histidine kinase/Tfp pilus assembly protein PilF
MRKLFLIFILFPFFSISQKLEGQKLIDSILFELPKMKEDTLKVNLLNELAYNYIFINEKTTFQYISKAEKLSKKLQYNNGIACSYINIGNAYIMNSKLDLAFKNYTIAHNLNPTKNIKGKIFLGYGLYFFSKNNLDKALFNLDKALQIFEDTNQKTLMASALNNIANVYKETKELDKAIKYYKQGLDINKSIGSTKNNEARLTNMASCYFLQKKFDLSLQFLFEALRYKNLSDNYKALIYGNIGNVYINKKQYEEGSFYIEKAIALNLKLDDNYGLSKNYTYLGFLNIQKSQSEKNKTESLNKAEFFVKKSIALEKEMNNEKNAWHQYDLLSQINKAKGNFEDALTAHEQYVIFKDSIFNSENKETIKNLEDKREIELRDKEIKINKLSLEAKEKQKWYLFGGLGLLTIIGGLLFYQSRKRKQINNKLQILNQNLDAKNLELDQANKAKTRFFSILNHDLRGPVANLIFFLQLQNESPEMLDAESTKRMQDKTMTGAENLLASMEDILQWSKSQMENFKPQPKNLLVNQLFEDTKKVFSGYLKISFEYHNPDNIEIFTDENYLKTIVRNLTSNAINVFTATKNPLIIWKAWQTNNQSYLSVTDNGPGASQEKFNSLFDEAEIGSTKSGLGLHLIRDMAKAIDCEISVESKLGEGTIFLMKLHNQE